MNNMVRIFLAIIDIVVCVFLSFLGIYGAINQVYELVAAAGLFLFLLLGVTAAYCREYF